MNKSLFLLVIAGLSLAFAPAPFPKPGKRESKDDDLARMQGAWVRVELGIGVEPNPDNCRVTITGTRMQFPSASDAWNLTLDLGKKPRTIDARHVDNANSLFRGIYRFEGDNLIICWRGAGADPERPTEFTAGVREVWYQVYKRQKP
jgi:uncharacterized protein (TIGR03067 family)